ncbi:hypothetical protein J4H86_18905 [Spiractinospora alimapuensis]|uniref:hypothetical protein n=1 Tax=Spiractinospora alimapuensis TaxID=2820884 RepID=UPI001F433A2E|nr:hypothetical protein [Spiractinospora alimapuensis]QVQ50914.1 hypothetical protein J4H86_18905 [Spiractinospora alimapuensis]
MSFDLCVWRENQPVTAARALRTHRWLCDDQRVGDPDWAELSIVADARVDRFHRELMGVYPPLEELGTQAVEASPWSMTPRHEHGLFAVMTMGFAHATAVAPVIVEMALRHGLVCFDPRQGEIHNPPEIVASDGPRLEFRDGGVVNNPHPGALPALLGQVTERNWFAILEHEPGWFMQVGVGEPAGGLDDGVYGLEFREGSEDRHFRVLVSDFGAMARAFQDYVTGDQRWKSVFDWQPLAPPTVDLAF